MAKKRKRRSRVESEAVEEQVTEIVSEPEVETPALAEGLKEQVERVVSGAPGPAIGPGYGADPTMKTPTAPPAGAVENQLWLLGGHALNLKANIEALSAALPPGSTLTAVRAAAAASDRARRNLIAALGSAAEAGQ